MKLDWRNTKFVKSALKPAEYPKLGHHTNQLAICGRSNVGKSSLINDLCETSGLAKTSKTPGKTQLINFFNIDDRLSLVDLPGYGYAKVPDSVKKDWDTVINQYLQHADKLKLILFLLDIRRLPSSDDLQFLDWLYHRNMPFLLVLTKIDKVSKSEGDLLTAKILEELPYEGIEYIAHSSKTHQGKLQLRKRIEEYGAH